MICSSYGVKPEFVKSKLSEGFSKYDVYGVCEEMSNSMGDGVGYASIIEESITEIPKPKKSENMTSSTIGSLIVNRRGK